MGFFYKDLDLSQWFGGFNDLFEKRVWNCFNFMIMEFLGEFEEILFFAAAIEGTSK